jgi:hypothetical protein
MLLLLKKRNAKVTEIPDTITVFQTEYSVSDHAKVRMEDRPITVSEIQQTLEDGTCREQAHGTDICEKEFWIEDAQEWKEVKVTIDRDAKKIVTVIVNQPA